MGIAEKSELFQIVGFLERENECNETGRVEREGYEAMVGDEWH